MIQKSVTEQTIDMVLTRCNKKGTITTAQPKHGPCHGPGHFQPLWQPR